MVNWRLIISKTQLFFQTMHQNKYGFKNRVIYVAIMQFAPTTEEIRNYAQYY
jgi:hypothetical protein